MDHGVYDLQEKWIVVWIVVMILSVVFCCAGKDFICVQSMDGTVSVFEQESFSFSRFLPGTLLPGPIGYVAKTDSIVTVASSRQVDCFKWVDVCVLFR